MTCARASSPPASRPTPATWSRVSARPRSGTTRCRVIARRSTGKACTRWRWIRTRRAVTRKRARPPGPTCAACAARSARSTWTMPPSSSRASARLPRLRHMPEDRAMVEAALQIELRDQRGELRRLVDFRGKNIVLYFYPMDDTPGCTVEGKEFRDQFEQFEALDAVIVGVRTDSAERHRAFADKHGFPFILLADTDGALASAFGVFRDGL